MRGAFIVPVLLLVVMGRAWGAPGVDLATGAGRVPLLPYAFASDSRSAFVPFSQYTPHGSPVSLWLRFSIEGPARADRPAWFIVLPRWTESAQLYRAGEPTLSTSMYVSYAKRPADLDVPAFPILERDYGGAPLLLHLTYYPDTQLDVALMTQEASTRSFEPTVTIEGMFLGVLLAVGVLNLFVFATTRDENALWYVLWLVSLAFGELATSSIGDRYLWSAFSVSSRLMTYAAQIASTAVFIMFARTFLRTRAEWPLSDRAMLAYVWAYAAIQTAAALVPGGSVLVPAVLFWQLGGMVLIAYVGVARYRSGYRAARYFALGFVPLAIGLGASLTWQTLQPSMDGVWFWAYNGTEIGIMLQTIVLSFGVADRIRMLEHAMEHTQRRLSEVSEIARVMESLAHVDELTGVANRNRFRKALDEHIRMRAASREPFALLFCDLDGFKVVNDEFGHHAGDEVLRTVALRLIRSLRSSDLVARLGGDEFVVLLEGASADQVARVRKTVETAFEEPIVIGGVTMPVGISIGMAMFPDDGDTSTKLLQFADRRMYESKQRRKIGNA
jgi:diguanylate cyclase (GGDEF)-like protein